MDIKNLTTIKPAGGAKSKHGDVGGTIKEILKAKIKDGKPQLFGDIVTALKEKMPSLKKQSYQRVNAVLDRTWFKESYGLVYTADHSKVICTAADLKKIKG